MSSGDDGGGGPVGLLFLDPEVVEAALSVLARKTRAELMLGLLEEFTAGRRSGRAVLADYRHALAGLSSAGGGGHAEWERLRQVGRAKGEPVVEWEILHSLDLLARRGSTVSSAPTPSGPTPSGRSVGNSVSSTIRRPRPGQFRRSPGLTTRGPEGGSQYRASASPPVPAPGHGQGESGMSVDPWSRPWTWRAPEVWVIAGRCMPTSPRPARSSGRIYIPVTPSCWVRRC